MGHKTFIGGVHPYDGKELSKDSPIKEVLPKGDMVYPVSQHIGAPPSSRCACNIFRSFAAAVPAPGSMLHPYNAPSHRAARRRTAAVMSSLPNTALPATRTSAPASTHSGAVVSSTPPSTSSR